MWGCLLLCAALLVQCCQANGNCGPGVNTPGVTLPKGDLILEHGDPLEIFCILNNSHPMARGANSSQLLFYQNDKVMLPEFVSIINSTTIRLYVEKPPPMRDNFYCKLQTPTEIVGVCLNLVTVAFKPQEVVNFTCVSHNWENLKCTWSKPQNFLKTTYSLRYRLPGRAGGRMLYGCPNNTEIDENSCYWDLSTDPHYRQPYEYYYFSMSGENSLANVTFPVIKFHHYTHVIPQAPVNLSVVKSTTHSVCLQWDVPFPMLIFPPGVIHRVRYQSLWDSRSHWTEVATTHMNTKVQNHILNVTHLKHANTHYEFKVSIKSASAAVGNDKWWSQPASITVKTNATVPGAAPKTDIGSFEVSGGYLNQFIYLYWQHIPEELENGDDFGYRVYRVDDYDREHLIEPIFITKAYAKFSGTNTVRRKYVIVSTNLEGHSVDKSTIYVPSRIETPREPQSLTKIAFGNGTYELSWRPPPERNLTIVNYTIFWCENDRDRPYQCTGFLNWEHVPRGVHVKKIQLPVRDKIQIHQFAISANTKMGSSGMVWASCTVIHDKVVGKMKNVWINQIGSRYIEVGWKLDCSDRVGMVTGYRITYCPIIGPQNISCKNETKQNTTIEGDSMTFHGRVEGLKPYTTYKLEIVVVTKSGDGPPSDEMLNTTMEAAPETAPLNFHVVNVTNTTIMLRWDPPLQTNGLLRFYTVRYNTQSMKVESDKTEALLTNLSSYSNFSISVSACTVECSVEAELPTGVVMTAIGTPSTMERPVVKFINSSIVSLSWQEPAHPAGPIQFYQLLVQHRNGDANISTIYLNSSGLTTTIPIPDCKDDGSSLVYSFAVRAVNIDVNDLLLPGVWSHPGESNCYNAAPVGNLKVIAWVFVVLLITALALAVAYLGKRIWHRCKVMQVVEVKLPAGLAPMNEKEIHIQVHSWPMSDSHDPHKVRPSAADEELLLDKKTSGHNPSGDSSGCSSGHESVSSSVGTHLSCDSGTEVDHRAPSPDGVFAESPSWEVTSLGAGQRDGEGEPYVRMGKMVSARSTPNLTDLEEMGGVGQEGGGGCLGTSWSSTGYISMPSSEEMIEPAGGYCRVGLDPTTMPSRQPAKGYVSIASMSTSPVPCTGGGYITHLPPKNPLSTTAGKAYVAVTTLYQNESSLPADSYCRMGLHPGAGSSSKGYIPMAEGAIGGGDPSTGYLPHTRLNNVFATPTNNTNGLCHVKSPTTSV